MTIRVIIADDQARARDRTAVEQGRGVWFEDLDAARRGQGVESPIGSLVPGGHPGVADQGAAGVIAPTRLTVRRIGAVSIARTPGRPPT